jgi:hypothetical protein
MSVETLSLVGAHPASTKDGASAPSFLSKLADHVFARIAETRSALDGWRAACRAADSWDSPIYH